MKPTQRLTNSRYRAVRPLSLTAVAALVFTAPALSQPPGGGNPFAERARTALAEPFVGITTGSKPAENLFPIVRTGVSTEPVRRAAEALLASLTEPQRTKILFSVDDSEWRNWANIHRFPRQGVSADEMSPEQREAAYGLLRAALSTKGFETSRDIMRLNHHLAELVANFDEYGEHLYFFTIMGTPSESEPWGWQIDGHHLVINYFVLGDQVVMTPTFMGSEPVSAESGPYAGTAVLEVEQEMALAFMRSLSDAQRHAAIVDTTKRRGNLAEMLSDNVTVAYEGIPATSLDKTQRERLLALIAEYVGNMDDGHAAVKMNEIRAHIWTRRTLRGKAQPVPTLCSITASTVRSFT